MPEDQRKAAPELIGAWYEAGESRVPPEGGPVAIELVLAVDEKISGILHTGSRDHPVTNAPLSLLMDLPTYFKGSWQYVPQRIEPLRTDAAGRFVALGRKPITIESPETASPAPGSPPSTPRGPSRAPGLPRGPSRGDSNVAAVLRVPWKTTDGRPATLEWPTDIVASGFKVLNIAGGGPFFDVDLSQLGTCRLIFSGPEHLAATGRSIWKPATVSWSIGRVWWAYMQREIALPEQSSADVLLFPYEYSFSSNLYLVEREPDVPEFERHSEYSFQRSPIINLKPGELKTVTYPVDQLDQWQRQKSNWHKRTEAATRPATQQAARQ
jgi:hypothetical protein